MSQHVIKDLITKNMIVQGFDQMFYNFGRREMVDFLSFFLGKDASMEDLVNDIEVISWKWFLARKKGGPYLYYEWFSNPLLCISF